MLVTWFGVPTAQSVSMLPTAQSVSMLVGVPTAQPVNVLAVNC